jgi:hypothetical protein
MSPEGETMNGPVKIWVYYDDAHEDFEGVGLESFDTEDSAAAFIAGRMADEDVIKYGHPRVESYTVIRGTQLAIEIVQRVSRIKIT